MALSTKYGTIHQWLSANYPKRRVCEACGKEGRTDYAFLHHPEPHTHFRDDYKELCVSCHHKMDYASGHRKPGTYASMLARKAVE